MKRVFLNIYGCVILLCSYSMNLDDDDDRYALRYVRECGKNNPVKENGDVLYLDARSAVSFLIKSNDNQTIKNAMTNMILGIKNGLQPGHKKNARRQTYRVVTAETVDHFVNAICAYSSRLVREGMYIRRECMDHESMKA